MKFKKIKINSSKIKGLSLILHWSCREGWNGEYNPKDPNDAPLLRFDVIKNKTCLDNGSYCTELKATDPRNKLIKAAKTILATAEESISNGNFKNRMALISWLSIDEIS